MATRVAETQLERWVELNSRRLALEREARQLSQELAMLSLELRAALEAAGKSSLSRGRFRLSLVDGRPSVSWKDQFVLVAGAEEAARIIAAAPVPQRVEVRAA